MFFACALCVATGIPASPPRWVPRSVVYVISVDRFENGDKANDPKGVESWEAEPTASSQFGGDLSGLRKKVDYVAALGINAVDLTPVFKASGADEFATSDFTTVDPKFGSDNDLVEFADELERRKIRLILDFVPAHCSIQFPPFQDVIRRGGDSAFKDWFFVQSYPVRTDSPPNYRAWHDMPSMPALNLANPDCRNYLLDAIGTWQNRTNVAALGLVRSDDVLDTFRSEALKRIQAHNQEGWIFTEGRSDGFRSALAAFFGTRPTKPSQFASAAVAAYREAGSEAGCYELNALDGPSLPRFRTVCGGSLARWKMATVLQFAWVGVPALYYGDEVGLEGGLPPANLRPMPWSKIATNDSNLKFVKRLIEIRKQDEALQSGTLETLLTDDDEDVCAFGRRLRGEFAVVAVNRSHQVRDVVVRLTPAQAVTVLAPNGYRNVVDGTPVAFGHDNVFRFSLAAESAAILLPEPVADAAQSQSPSRTR